MERIATGFANLDRLASGGLPSVPDTVVSGSEEDVYLFSQRLLWNCINAGGLCLYGTLSRTREDVLMDLASGGLDASPFINAGSLRIVDFLSLAGRKPQTPDEKLKAILLLGEEALSPDRFHKVLTEEFQDLTRGKSRRFLAILDSVDKLITIMGLENTLRFEEMVVKLFRDTNSLGIALLYDEYTSDEDREAARAKASIFIELKKEKDKKQVQRMFRITKGIYIDWTPLL